MKKLFCVSAQALLLILLISLPSHAGTISIDPALKIVNVGQPFQIFVNVDSIIDLYAYQFDLVFDPAVINATAVNDGLFLQNWGGGPGSNFFIPGAIDNGAGTITYTADTLLTLIPGASGNGTLAMVDFVAIAPGTSSLSFSNMLFLDSSLSDITNDISHDDGSVEVLQGAAVPEPSTVLLLAGGLIGLAAVARGRH